jgi:hypothetical protein
MQSKVEITVVWGEETFNPQPYTSLKVGPFSVTTTCLESEVEVKIKELHDRLSLLAKNIKSAKYHEFNKKEGT